MRVGVQTPPWEHGAYVKELSNGLSRPRKQRDGPLLITFSPDIASPILDVLIPQGGYFRTTAAGPQTEPNDPVHVFVVFLGVFQEPVYLVDGQDPREGVRGFDRLEPRGLLYPPLFDGPIQCGKDMPAIGVDRIGTQLPGH